MYIGFLLRLVQQLQEIACAFVTPLSLLLPVSHDQHALQACARLSIPMHQVDAHNVVPVWVASDKKETAARTIRKKIHSKLPIFLTVSQGPWCSCLTPAVLMLHDMPARPQSCYDHVHNKLSG